MDNLLKKIYNIIEMSTDNKNQVALYDVFMMLSIILSIIPLCFKDTNILLNLIDKITVTIFIIDYILRWITFKFKLSNYSVARATLKYPLTFFAIIDLLSILPSLTVLNSGFRLLKILRLFRSFKVLKLLRYSNNFIIITNVIKKEKNALISICCMAIGYILISALIMFSVEPESFNTFFDSIYWATTALTTVGYGDIYPVTVIGKIVSMISSLVGIAVVALPAGVITAGFMNELKINK